MRRPLPVKHYSAMLVIAGRAMWGVGGVTGRKPSVDAAL